MRKGLALSLPKGFTLIELLVVIAVLGVLAGGVFVAINPLKRINQARDSQIKSDIGQIAQAAQGYFTLNQTYPLTVSVLKDSGDLKTEPKTPTDDSYSIVGAPQGCAGTSVSPCTNMAIFAPINDAKATGNVWCWRSADNGSAELPTNTCQSTLDQKADIFSIGNPVLNGSFEVDSNNDGAADNWSFDCNVAGYCSSGSVIRNDGSIIPQDGTFMQKVNAAQYAGIVQSITGLKPSTTYKLTAMIYSTSNNCANNPNGVSVGMSFGGTAYTLCNQLNQWVQLSIQSESDAQGKATISVGNWNSQLFYVDAVRLEEI